MVDWLRDFTILEIFFLALLDEAIEYLTDDELLEVTPKNLRIRKRILDKSQRARETKRVKQAIGV